MFILFNRLVGWLVLAVRQTKRSNIYSRLYIYIYINVDFGTEAAANMEGGYR